MNDQDLVLHRRLAAIADDAPSQASIVLAERVGYRRRVHRRRWHAIGSVVAVVLVVTGATTLLAPGRTPDPIASGSSVTTTLGSRALATATPLAADSQLVPFAGVGVTSPVSVPASWVSYDPDGPDVHSEPSSLQVVWAGAEPTAVQTIDARSGTTGTGQYRGYLITAQEPTLDVSATGDDTKAVSTTITLNGHEAALLTAPAGSYDNTYGAPAQARIAWQLGNGRWIQVWTVGESTAVLTAFAASITEKPTEFPADLSIGMTLKGFTSARSSYSSFVSQMGGPGLALCRPSSSAVASSAAASQAPLSSGVPASVGPSSSGAVDAGQNADECLSVQASVADGGFGAGFVMGDESNAQFVAESVGVDVGGIKVHVNAKYQVAWTTWGKATITVQGPGGEVTVSTADLAALAASVRLSPVLEVRNQPNPLVESSLAEMSAQGAGQDGSTR